MLRPVQKCSYFVRFKYRLYQSRFGHTGINIGFRSETRYQAKQKKKLRKAPKFQHSPPHSYLSFSSSSSYLSLLLISSSFPLFHQPLFLWPLHLLHLMCLSLFQFWYTHLKVEKQSDKKQVTRLQSKTCGCEKKNEKKNLTYKERLMGYNCKQDVWSENKKIQQLTG